MIDAVDRQLVIHIFDIDTPNCDLGVPNKMSDFQFASVFNHVVDGNQLVFRCYFILFPLNSSYFTARI